MTDVVREYNHRAFGHVGKVVLSAKVTEMKINGTALPESSIEYLLTFALQSLQDAYAGATDAAGAKGAFDTKFDRLVNGTIGVRTGGGASVSEETRVARTITKAKLLATWGKDSKEATDFKALDADAQNARLDEVYGKNEAKLKPFVVERMGELKAERQRREKLAKQSGVLEL
jgi:hypothetical protein